MKNAKQTADPSGLNDDPGGGAENQMMELLARLLARHHLQRDRSVVPDGAPPPTGRPAVAKREAEPAVSGKTRKAGQKGP